MRNNLWYSIFITLLLIALGSVGVKALQGSDDGLSLIAPAACPASGCAAGQRLNFGVDFAIDPQYFSGHNTQVCVYTLADGQSGSGSASWADYSQGWIAEDNTDPAYTQGELGSVCTDAAPKDHEILVGAYAQHTAEKNEQIEFALHINPSTDIDGDVRVKIFQVDSSGSNWVETTNTPSTFIVPISVEPLETTVYAAENPGDCEAHTPCFVDSGDDKQHGLGTALYDAVQALQPGGEIIILKDLFIKTFSVKIDKNLTIKGYNGESMLTSINSEDACGNNLLRYQAAGTLQDLTLNDGNCSASNSRTLIEVDIENPDQLTIQKNNLNLGKIGIHVRNNTGTVTIAFNKITNHQAEAVLIEAGSSDSDRVNIYANNIINNGSGLQVNCNSSGTAEHNFWGEAQLPVDNTTDCGVLNGKGLGAPILPATASPGVQGILKTVKSDFLYYFDGQVGVRHTEGDDFDIVIVNHGQGKDVNIPFYESGSGNIVPCGNFYDIFLAKGSSPRDLEISLKYDLSESCINVIESDYYCGNSSQTRYPLWWFDPLNDVTEGWDRTGQAPQGPGGSGDAGQVTACNTQQDAIIVKIDNSGRPGLFSDLTFTPFTTGFIDGAYVLDFSAIFTNFYSRVSWKTLHEMNIKRYELLRSTKINSGYKEITSIDVGKDSSTTNTYQFYDYDVDLSTTYYYKLRVIHDSASEEIIALHGPFTLKLPAPTITRTPTVTRTPFPTRTPFYRTPTRSYFRSSTPAGAPTRVRTFGPSPTEDLKPTSDRSPTSTITPYPESGYPSGGDITPTEAAYPAPEDQTITPTQSNADSQGTPTPPAGGAPDSGNVSASQASPRVMHFLIGLGGGLFLLLGASLILVKTFFL